MKPRIAITLGDPAGIGPEVIAKALRDPRIRRICDPLVMGPRVRVPMGRPTREAGRAALTALQEGIDLVLCGRAGALVTAPVSKEAFRMAGHGLPGHTEWLAQEAGVKRYGMLMASGPMRALLRRYR